MFKHKENSFVAWIMRLKWIKRWPLMHSLMPEQVATHSFEVAIIAHNIALIGVDKFNREYNPSDICVAALYHEASESAGLSDIPSPVKYANPDITEAVKDLERNIEQSLIENATPQYLQKHLRPFVIQNHLDPIVKGIVKSADDIAAYFKTTEEINLSNMEFHGANISQKQKVLEACKKYPEVKEFYDTQLPPCLMTLDQLTNTTNS